MFGNILSATWRSAVRDRFYAVLNVLGLGLGFAAAILIGLFVRDELSYDRFVPGYQDLYRVQLTDQTGDRPFTNAVTPAPLAAEMKLAFPEIAEVTRFGSASMALRHGDVQATETVVTADANFFSMLGFPMLRGDKTTALAEPNSVVLARSIALKYFGTIDCLDQILEIDGVHPVRVTGIAEDLPTNNSIGTRTSTGFGFKVVLSGAAPFGYLAAMDRQSPTQGELLTSVATFARLRGGITPETLAGRFPAFTRANYLNADGSKLLFNLFLNPLADLHLHPFDPDTGESNDRVATLYAVAATGALILLLAGINFVNLVTARATRRALEVGVRKAMGATRGQLMLQFMGEAIFYAVVGMTLGVALAELCLPSLNGFLDRQIVFDYWRHPLLALPPVAMAMLVGLVAGLYPAVVLSSFPPAMVLKSRSGGPIGGGKLRLALVVFQFTVTIALVIATSVIYRQNVFAVSQALRFDKDLVLTVDLAGLPTGKGTNVFGFPSIEPTSREALRTRLAAVPGVQAVADSMVVPVMDVQFTADYRASAHLDRPKVSLNFLPVGPGFFDLYRLPLIAGRDLSFDRADDKTSFDDMSRTSSAIINETAMRALGFTDPAAAIGQELAGADPEYAFHHRIIGVVPDFPLNSIRSAVLPGIFVIEPGLFRVLSLKLSGGNLSETLSAIDAAWHEFVPSRPISRSFIDDRVARLYLDVVREGRLFAAFAGFAAAIGCLGLVGLSAYTAERRTKEIGIRKALGASTLDVTKLLIWQFVKPVVLANALAWPIAWWFMRNWLDGFAYRIPLGPTPFLAAGLAALAIAVLTTGFHALKVARSRPILALRYE
jgi:putative ABC transport system permease protein